MTTDLIAEMEALLKSWAETDYGCTEEGCGCPGSRLADLVAQLKEEFQGVRMTREVNP